MTQLATNIFAVEVPEGAFSENNELGYYANIEYFDKMHYDPLPPGSWQLLCTTREAQDKDTICLPGESIIGLSNLPDLLTSKGLDENKNYVLLKKKVK